uniref:Uncharacterized protein n=1 Tax=Rhizophora mucronata TaxID=61149 RepID=A0A2P2MXV1_RHIMU
MLISSNFCQVLFNVLAKGHT